MKHPEAVFLLSNAASEIDDVNRQPPGRSRLSEQYIGLQRYFLDTFRCLDRLLNAKNSSSTVVGNHRWSFGRKILHGKTPLITPDWATQLGGIRGENHVHVTGFCAA